MDHFFLWENAVAPPSILDGTKLNKASMIGKTRIDPIYYVPILVPAGNFFTESSEFCRRIFRGENSDNACQGIRHNLLYLVSSFIWLVKSANNNGNLLTQKLHRIKS